MAIDLKTVVATKLSQRDWKAIRSSWVNHVSTHVFVLPRPFQPIDTLASYPPMQMAAQAAMSSSPNIYTLTDAVLRRIAFDETLFQIHKAAHILCCANVLISSGKRTWPLAQTYQSAYFSAMAIFGLLGISIPEFTLLKSNRTPTKKSAVVDTIPRAGLATTASGAVEVVIIERVQHLPRWTLLKHIISSTLNPLWQSHLVAEIGSLADDDFEDQRNRLNYDPEQWFFGDMTTDLHTPPDYGRVNTTVGGYLAYSKANRSTDFGIRLAVILLGLCVEMLKDIAKYTNRLNDDLNALNVQLSDISRHDVFASSVL